nr:alpha-L-arabinofuranosidase C-terminal domain-containing protein [Lacticaseibacillus baoqingensis]
MGTVIYTGVYEPTHPTATAEGFRGDVLQLVQALGIKTLRYPGGNFTSSYHWEDTVGPKDQRPKRMNIAWQSLETNQFGLHEFFSWAAQAGIDNPILTVNLGTRGIDDALNELEYVNGRFDTYWANKRRQNGHPEPFGVKYWCLGNELDGPWQVARQTPEAYGLLANETAKAMKLMDPQIETILVGSSTPNLDSYPEWDFKVLMAAYDNVDFIAMHNYIDRAQSENLDQEAVRAADDLPTYLAKSLSFDRQIDEVATIADAVKALKHSDKTMKISFDEWNVHHFSQKQPTPWGEHNPVDWCYFDLADTLLFGSMALAILRHGDRVKLSCQALLVNTIPLILTDEAGAAWANPTYYVLQALLAQLSDESRVLKTDLIGAVTYDTAEFLAVPMIDQVLIDTGTSYVLFAVNRGEETQTLAITLPQPAVSGQHQVLCGALDAQNTREHPHTLTPQTKPLIVATGAVAQQVSLPGYSWNVVTFNY